jgi:site-specific DNA-methyltransferase (adenine-specific)
MIRKSDAVYRQRVTWDRCGMQAFNNVRFYRVEEDIYVLGKRTGAPGNFVWNKEAAKYLSVWRIPPERKRMNHPAPFPSELAKRCIEAFTEPGMLVLDPYSGTGTTCAEAKRLGRQYIGFEKSPKYAELSEDYVANLSYLKRLV